MSLVALVGATVLPHFAAFLAIAAAVVAGIGMRLSTKKPQWCITGLIVSISVFVLCVVYTIVTIVLGFS